MNHILIEWEKSDNILDNFFIKNEEIRLNLRIYSLKNLNSNLEYMINKIIDINDIVISEDETLVGKLLTGLFLILSINPLDFKILKGKGIDEIIDQLEINSDTNEVVIEKRKIDNFIKSKQAYEQIIKWFIENKLFILEEGIYIYKGKNIKSAKIFSLLN